MPLIHHKSHIKCPAGGGKFIANHLIHDTCSEVYMANIINRRRVIRI
jgi:hypothetical protein